MFNTPNDKSRPGYLKMGWELVGVLRPHLRPRSPLALPTLLRGRVPAAHWGEASGAGQLADDVFANEVGTEELLAASRPPDGQLSTNYALVLDGTWRDVTLPVPGQGPTLTWRSICESGSPPLARWALTMGDIELF